jgi:hypothetical protein
MCMVRAAAAIIVIGTAACSSEPNLEVADTAVGADAAVDQGVDGYETTPSDGADEVDGLPPTSEPYFNPPPGTYLTPMRIELFSATAGAEIYYTVNGDSPTLASTKYTGTPVAFVGTTTLKAIAIAPAHRVSTIAVGNYVRSGGSPPVSVTFDPPGGTYDAPQTVAMLTPTSGATICYAYAPEVPGCDTTSADVEQCVRAEKYTGKVTVVPTPAGIILRAVACRWGYGTSEVNEARYTTP